MMCVCVCVCVCVCICVCVCVYACVCVRACNQESIRTLQTGKASANSLPCINEMAYARIVSFAMVLRNSTQTVPNYIHIVYYMVCVCVCVCACVCVCVCVYLTFLIVLSLDLYFLVSASSPYMKQEVLSGILECILWGYTAHGPMMWQSFRLPSNHYNMSCEGSGNTVTSDPNLPLSDSRNTA